MLHPCSIKGAAKSLGNTWSAGKAAWVSALIAAGAAFLTGIVVVPLLMRQSRKHIQAVEERAAQEAEEKR
jgi:ABC-type Fe3+ transport system permease subunit